METIATPPGPAGYPDGVFQKGTSMTRLQPALLFSLLVAATVAAPLASASAANGPLARRGGYAYAVSPAMMHAIDVIVAEKTKMAHRAH